MLRKKTLPTRRCASGYLIGDSGLCGRRDNKCAAMCAFEYLERYSDAPRIEPLQASDNGGDGQHNRPALVPVTEHEGTNQ